MTYSAEQIIADLQAMLKDHNYIAYAIPFFFLLIAVELIVAVVVKRKLYRLNDSLNDLAMGTYSRLIGLFYSFVLLFAYAYIYYNWRFWDLPTDQVWAWVVGFLGVDMMYYWFHRKSHEVSVIWGSHEPHHQSEEYNLTVALRQGSFQGIFSMPFYFPLALFGLHPLLFFVMSQFNTLYQFWIHTRAIDKLGPFEWVFNTPSHHRVHHGKNPKYIDRNHAGTLIIWDKVFGTFQAEEEEPVYGTVKPLASWNPMWANIQYWYYLLKLTRKADTFMDKLRVWYKPPGFKPANLGAAEPIPEVFAESYKKYDPKVHWTAKTYGVLQFLGATAGSLYFIQMGPAMLNWIGALFGFLMLLQFVGSGFVFENRRRSGIFEAVRIVATQLLLVWLWPPMQNEIVYLVVSGFNLLSILFLYGIKLGRTTTGTISNKAYA